MAAFRAKPSFVRPQWGHEILKSQSCWFVANDVGRAPTDILKNPPPAAGSLGANVGNTNSPWGSAFSGTGGATSFVDLGSTNRFITTDVAFSISWIEQHTGAAVNQGIVNLFPSGGSPATKSFVILRPSDNTLSAATYGRLSVGRWVAASSLVGTIAPPKLTDNLPLVFVLLVTAGWYTSTSSVTAWWDGGATGTGVLTTSGNSAALGATQNYFGWDNADSKFSGGLDNLRVWNRLLDTWEIQAVLGDPYVGCVRTKMPWPASAVVVTNQSQYFLACQ